MNFNVLIIYCIIATTKVNAFVELNWEPMRPAFDPEIYKNALNSEICNEQLQHITSTSVLRLKFLEAGMRIPKAITEFNTVDYGNYDQCLGIKEDIGTSVIEGKYCMIRGPINNDLIEVAKKMNWSELDPLMLSKENLNQYKQIEEIQRKIENIRNGVNQSSSTPTVFPALRMALCIPKSCTTQKGLSGLLFNLTSLGFRYEEQYCRFKDDKPWVPGDYVAISIFTLIGVLTFLSTSYDILHTFIYKTDTKTVSDVYKSFSVYNNGKRLTTFTHNPNILNCVDGIRAISMFWIVIGHTYSMMPPMYNVFYTYVEYLRSLKSLWVTAVPYTVDTFFFLAGMLLVYTTVGKITGSNFLKSLHLFYLNRLLRMFPLLATLVLLQATLLFKIADGPDWNVNAKNTNDCRTYWWATLLYVQNYVGYRDQCIQHSWYLAIDIQCYIVAPLVLYWVLDKNKKKQAWIALICGVLAALTVAATYSFIQQFRGWITLAPDRDGGNSEYPLFYYNNTITRAPPFFIGMLFGYVLYVKKGRRPKISHYLTGLLWILSGGILLFLIYITHLMKDSSWDYWVITDLHNSFGRSIWVLAIAWIIFACQHGYGGPVNWFLCLDIWKLPSRISYGIYLFHYHIQFVIQGMARQPVIFSDALAIYHFLAQVLMSFGVAFTLTLLIDSPCSVLIKYALGSGIKNSHSKKI